VRSRLMSFVVPASWALVCGCSSEPQYNAATTTEAAAVASQGGPAVVRRPPLKVPKRPPKPDILSVPAGKRTSSALND